MILSRTHKKAVCYMRDTGRAFTFTTPLPFTGNYLKVFLVPIGSLLTCSAWRETRHYWRRSKLVALNQQNRTALLYWMNDDEDVPGFQAGHVFIMAVFAKPSIGV